jgi:hypothetical protein
VTSCSIDREFAADIDLKSLSINADASELVAVT